MSGLITISSLGSRGRVGNALFQYAFAKGYAMAVGAELQTPPWWGRKCFTEAASDPLITKELPRTVCDSVCQQRGWPVGYFIGKTDIDLFGYFQNQIFLEFYTRQQVKEWLKFKIDFMGFEPMGLYHSSSGKFEYSAAHIRKGDYNTDPLFQKLYCEVSLESYSRAIGVFNIPKSVAYVWEGKDEPAPVLVAQGLGWLQDFFLLRDASYLLRANSTFSWWAGTLGAGKIYSPLVLNKVGKQDVDFVPGNWPNTAGIFPNQSDLHLRES